MCDTTASNIEWISNRAFLSRRVYTGGEVDDIPSRVLLVLRLQQAAQRGSVFHFRQRNPLRGTCNIKNSTCDERGRGVTANVSVVAFCSVES